MILMNPHFVTSKAVKKNNRIPHKNLTLKKKIEER